LRRAKTEMAVKIAKFTKNAKVYLRGKRLNYGTR